MAAGDTKVVINSVTYTNSDTLIAITNHSETEDSQTADLLLNNSDKVFTALNLRGLAAVISYDYGSGYVATAPLTVITQDDTYINGRLLTTLHLLGIPDLLAEDKASKDVLTDAADTKTVKDMLTEVLDGTAVVGDAEVTQTTSDTDLNLDGDIVGGGQVIYIQERTVKSLSFRLKKFGDPNGDITFFIRSTGPSETLLVYKVWADANTLTTSYAWIKVTWTTPIYVNEEVRLYCTFTDGDASNYVAVEYNSASVVDDEYLAKLSSTAGWIDYADLDCAYKYEYQSAGVGCFAHCTALVATFDPHGTHTGGTHATIMTDSAAAFKVDALIGQVIYNTTDGSSGTITDNNATTVTVVALAGGSDNQWEASDAYIILDALMDVYTPKAAFKIAEGESRLSVVNRLLSYTGEVKRVEDDGKVHIFVPIVSGTSYDASYTTAVGHNMYSSTKRKALVIPNKIVVKSYDDDDGYTGSATSAASYALLPVSSQPIRATVSGNTQAASLAAAMITRLEVNAQKGSANVPMELFTQIWDYTYVNHVWRGDTDAGNVSYLNRQVAGGIFRIFFSFGRQTTKGVAGTQPKKEGWWPDEELPDETVLRWGMLKGIFDEITKALVALDDDQTNIEQFLADIGADVSKLDRDIVPPVPFDGYTKTAIDAKLAAYLLLAGGTMTGAIAMGNSKVTGLAAGTENGDALRYEQLIGTYLLLAGGTMAGNIAMGANKITGLPKTIVLSVAGTLVAGVNASFEIPVPVAMTIGKVYANVKTAPTGANLEIDVNKNGTTIFTSQAKRPIIAAGDTEDESDTPDVTALAKGDLLSIDIDQIGSTIAGADLVVEVRCTVAA